MNWWVTDPPDAVTGWNIQLFDIPYMVVRTEKLFGDDMKKGFSPFSLIKRKEVKIGNRQFLRYDIWGVAQLDYLDLYRKFTYVTRESYKLDHITEVELGHKKLENPHDSFREFYTGEFDVHVSPADGEHETRHKGYQRTLMKQELIRRGLLDTSSEQS